ncbi:MAG: 4-alpha-glucanotransferase [Desulfuromonas sp.]|nr:4-alpha-glucanotransferase [Desulfuromonas sp.]
MNILPSKTKRSAGVLLHPTSLPNGVLDENVERFLDWMVVSGLSVWQMLPLGAPHRDRSPYQAYSSHALNPALLPSNLAFVPIDEDELAAFQQAEAKWLDDYALFVALHEHYDNQQWSDWPQEYRCRQPQALQQFASDNQTIIRQLQWDQCLLFKRWEHIKRLAHERNIVLFGDLPIAVSYDSADVWTQPQLFKLNDQLQPTVVAGVPPDYFSATGQRWGNPHYNWDLMAEDDFAWWRWRMASALRQVDLVRIDHFRGLQALWEIPASETTAMHGTWVKTPGRQLLQALKEDFPSMPFVAEDLGVINAEVVALREEFSLPSLSVLQFGFPPSADNPHSLANQVKNSVVYTGTHDNNTTCGWFADLEPEVQQQVLQQLPQGAGSMPWPLIEAALQSVAQMAIIPMQDWLALGAEHRTNTPSTTEDNWSWRFIWRQVPPHLSEQIRSRLLRSKRYSTGGTL